MSYQQFILWYSGWHALLPYLLMSSVIDNERKIHYSSKWRCFTLTYSWCCCHIDGWKINSIIIKSQECELASDRKKMKKNKQTHSNLFKIGVIKIKLFPTKIFLSFVHEIPNHFSHVFYTYSFEGKSAPRSPLCLQTYI